ncbi:MauE/DoxX family redox-associated membrane protein [candidate division KSB1 bacterium]
MNSISNKLSYILYFLLRFFLGIIFIAASIDKIANPEKLLEIINNYDIVPVFITPFAAIILPWIEFICGLFLLFGILIRSAASILIFLLVIFIFGISVNLYRGADIECGCFGLLFGGESIGFHSIIRDIMIMVFAGILIYIDKNKWTIENYILKNMKAGNEAN